MSDPMEPMQKLMEAFGKEVEKLGMQLHTFAVLPNPDGPPHAVQAMMVFDGADLAAAQAASDEPEVLSDVEKDAFEMLARDFERDKVQEEADEVAAALKKLQESLESGTSGGILGDDED